MSIIRDAATILLIRSHKNKKLVLMGRRSSKAVFMPSKYVFPGGALEKDDYTIPVAKALSPTDRKLLDIESDGVQSTAIGVTAVRELWEETGLRLAAPVNNAIVPKNWKGFFLNGYGPNLKPLNFFFRAITPPGRPRRFDARFFICDASHILDDLDDFEKASTELSDLKWIDIRKAKELELPKITSIVIAEAIKLIDSKFRYRVVPFYTGGSGGNANKMLKT